MHSVNGWPHFLSFLTYSTYVYKQVEWIQSNFRFWKFLIISDLQHPLPIRLKFHLDQAQTNDIKMTQNEHLILQTISFFIPCFLFSHTAQYGLKIQIPLKKKIVSERGSLAKVRHIWVSLTSKTCGLQWFLIRHHFPHVQSRNPSRVPEWVAGLFIQKKIHITGNERENYTLLEHALKNVLFPKISSNT